MITIPASRVRRCCAALLTGSLVLTASACGGDGADGPDDTTPTAAAAETGTDFSLSYDVPERWDADSVTAVLESSMIGGGVNGRSVVADGALFVGEGLNQVKRATEEGTELLDVTPLKSSSVEQQDFRMEGFRRNDTDFVALWRQGVPESNDSRRLGDENDADREVFLTVLDSSGEIRFDGALDGATEPGYVAGGLAKAPGETSRQLLAYDPLTGESVSGDGGDGEDPWSNEPGPPVTTVAGYDTRGNEVTTVTSRLPTSDARLSRGEFNDYDHHANGWSSRDVLDAGDKDTVHFAGVAGDYAFFRLKRERPPFGTEVDEDLPDKFVVHIPDGTVAYSGNEDCLDNRTTRLEPDVGDSTRRAAFTSADQSVIVRGRLMFDADRSLLTCEEVRGDFAPYVVLDDGTVYGYGEQGSGDGAQQVAASMQVGDEEALMEQGSLPIHVDADGRGWFADAVNHSNGTDTVVAVVEPAEGGSRS